MATWRQHSGLEGRHKVSNDLQQAIAAIKSGDKATGQQLLAQVVNADPQNEAAWLWLASTLDDPQEKKECLQKVLQINPRLH